MTRELPTNDLIREVLGSKHPVILGWTMLIETYNAGDSFLSNEGEQSLFIRPDASKERDVTQMAVGRILMIGDACFNGPKFAGWKLKPEVGDYVSYPKYQGTLKTELNSDTGKEVQTIEIEDILIKRIVRNPSQCSTHHFVGQ